MNKSVFSVSIIIPVNRPDYIYRCLDSIESQNNLYKYKYEVILICDPGLKLETENVNVRVIHTKELNPAVRRNLATSKSQADILCFVDDDVTVDKDWLSNAMIFLEKNLEVGVLGGPDYPSLDPKFCEIVSDALLSTRFIGSGVTAHIRPLREFEIKSPSGLVLCNLFIRKNIFEKIGGLNEKIGYIGEDTELLFNIYKNKICKLYYKPDVVVYHKKRAFPFSYVRQRLLYRFKMGKMIYVFPQIYLKNYKIPLFLILSTLFILLPLYSMRLFIYGCIGYMALIFLCSMPSYLRDVRLVLVLPFAFPIHHIVYYAGSIAGLLIGLIKIRHLITMRRVIKVRDE